MGREGIDDRKPRFVQPLNLVSFNSAHGATPRRTRAIIALHRARMTLYTPRLSTASPPLNYLLVLSFCLSLSLFLSPASTSRPLTRRS